MARRACPFTIEHSVYMNQSISKISRINLLDAHLANQIAAGEVIERPSSVIKELLENSLDAGASQIDVSVEDGGVKLIKVHDDGYGIAKDDLLLAVARHATSKIGSFEDLLQVMSLGFRGEALASIAAVSRLTLTSRTIDADSGWQIKIEGSNVSSEIKPKPAAHLQGTTIEIRDLFFNVPARRKFLRSSQTEFNRIDEVVRRLALSNFDVGFFLKHNGNAILQLPKAISNQEKERRIANVCGKQFMEHAFALTSESGALKLTGWIGLPLFTRSQSDLQYFYLNGRMVRDKLITQALRVAYRNVIPHDRHPAVVLYLSIDPELVDINVHPTKSEVRFRDSRVVFDFLVTSIKKAIATLKPKDTINLPDNNIEREFLVNKSQPQTTAGSEQLFFVFDDETKNTSKVNLISEENAEYAVNAANTANTANTDTTHPFTKQQYVNDGLEAELPFNKFVAAKIESSAFELKSTVNNVLVEKGNIPPLGFAIAQLHNTYILAQNANGLILVDAHAAHERINYEKMQKDFLKGGIEKQELLVPLDIAVSFIEANCAENNLDLFNQVGIDLARIAPESLMVRSIPAVISDDDISILVRDIIADLLSFGESSRVAEAIDKVLATMACHGSVRGMRKMTELEMNSLLREIEITDRGGQCGHGRPTWVQLHIKEIEKMFWRGR